MRGAYRMAYRVAWGIRRAVKPLTTQAFRHRVRHALLRKAYFDDSYCDAAAGDRAGAARWHMRARRARSSNIRRTSRRTPRSRRGARGRRQRGRLPRRGERDRRIGAVDAAHRQGGRRPGGADQFPRRQPVAHARGRFPASTPRRTSTASTCSTSTPTRCSSRTTSLGASLFEGRYNIGFWAWELPEFPDAWVPRSTWSTRCGCLRRSASRPSRRSRRCRCCACRTRSRRRRMAPDRARFGIAPDDVAFFAMCDVFACPSARIRSASRRRFARLSRRASPRGCSSRSATSNSSRTSRRGSPELARADCAHHAARGLSRAAGAVDADGEHRLLRVAASGRGVRTRDGGSDGVRQGGDRHAVVGQRRLHALRQRAPRRLRAGAARARPRAVSQGSGVGRAGRRFGGARDAARSRNRASCASGWARADCAPSRASCHPKRWRRWSRRDCAAARAAARGAGQGRQLSSCTLPEGNRCPDRWFVVYAVAAMAIALGGCGSRLAVAPDRDREPLMLLGTIRSRISPTANRCVAIPNISARYDDVVYYFVTEEDRAMFGPGACKVRAAVWRILCERRRVRREAGQRSHGVPNRGRMRLFIFARCPRPRVLAHGSEMAHREGGSDVARSRRLRSSLPVAQAVRLQGAVVQERQGSARRVAGRASGPDDRL